MKTRKTDGDHRQKCLKNSVLGFLLGVLITNMGLVSASWAQIDPITLVQIIDTSQFSTPSPDPMGITYLGYSDTLLLSDSEVNETDLFTGDNLFDITKSGDLNSTATTTSFSIEPTGITYNPANRHLFISDDDQEEVFEIAPGPDGIHHTSDDIITSFDTNSFGSSDPEGIAYDSWHGTLFIVGGISAQVYKVTPGLNGFFDGAPPTGDDQVTHFDTEALGITDPEGIAFNSDTGTLFIVGETAHLVAEITTSGALLRMLDISEAAPLRPSGLAYAPGSLDPTIMTLYITDRGVDNYSDPDENDGKVYEIAFAPITMNNTPPAVTAGTDQSTKWYDGAIISSSVTDDGIPNPPGEIITTWSQRNGPGTVIFGDPGAVETTADFSTPGTYVLRLTADDGELQSSDEITIVVTGYNPDVVSKDVRISAGADDAEERITTRVNITSSDLEMIFDIDSGGDQTVGLRFNGVDIPQGTTILNAYVQFQTHEISSTPATLIIKGEDGDDASTFATSRENISSRPQTTALEYWSPVPWMTVGEALNDQRTPNIASVIQEIVNRSGWVSGNSLAIIISGSGKRVAESYDGMPQAAPLLHVEYDSSGTPPSNTQPAISAGPDQTIPLPESALLDGDVTDDGLPDPPAAVVTTWSKKSGPGDVTFGNPSNIDTTAAFSAAGTYVLELLADDGELQNRAELTVTVTDPGSGTAIREIRISSSSDDAEETPSGRVRLTSSDLELVDDGGEQTVGLRFNGIGIPPGATIINAYVQFQADERNGASGVLNIQGEAVDSATLFISSNYNLSSRTFTNASVTWTPEQWDTVGEAGDKQRTPNIASVIQEIVNRSGWLSNNSLVIIITGSGERVAESYDGMPNAAPLLHVEYSTSGPVDDTTPPVWDGSATGIGMAVDAGTGDAVNIKFDTAIDDRDGRNLKFNIYYAETSRWNQSDWTQNTVLRDVSPQNGGDNPWAYTYEINGLNENTAYTFGVRVEDQSGNEDANDNIITAIPTSAGGGGQTEFVFNPVADTFVNSSRPNTSRGASSKIYVNASPTKIGYFRFDVSGLSGNVLSAHLRLRVYNGSDFGGTISSISDNSWNEATMTYNTRPAIDGAPLDSLGRVNAPDIVEFDITAAINGNGSFSFAIDSTSTNEARYRSREYTASPPELVIVTD